MADIQHKNITDPQIHEPKGISTAGAGEVYVADGEGSGSWQSPTALPNTQMAKVHFEGTRYKKGSMTGIPSLLTPADFVQIDGNRIKIDSGLYLITENIFTYEGTTTEEGYGDWWLNTPTEGMQELGPLFRVSDTGYMSTIATVNDNGYKYTFLFKSEFYIQRITNI